VVDPALYVIAHSNIEFAIGILQDVDGEIHDRKFGCSGRIRTYDQSVNPDAVGTLPLSYALNFLAPAVGFEPTTNRLTADRSTTELRWIVLLPRSNRAAYILPTPFAAASASLSANRRTCQEKLVAGASPAAAGRVLQHLCNPVLW
jgi:hypothetical protein